MIACKLAAMVPERILSLALLNVTGGGFECFPKVRLNLTHGAVSYVLLDLFGLLYEKKTICFYVLQLDRLTLSIAIRFWMAKTPKQRAKVDLDTHYSQVGDIRCGVLKFYKNQIDTEQLLSRFDD